MVEREVELVNLTHHPIVLHTDRGEVELKATERPARVKVNVASTEHVEFNGHKIVLVTSEPGLIDHLPPPETGRLLVVSRAVAAAAADRQDLVVPDDLHRDSSGRVLSASRLARIQHLQG